MTNCLLASAVSDSAMKHNDSLFRLSFFRLASTNHCGTRQTLAQLCVVVLCVGPPGGGGCAAHALTGQNGSPPTLTALLHSSSMSKDYVLVTKEDGTAKREFVPRRATELKVIGFFFPLPFASRRPFAAAGRPATRRRVRQHHAADAPDRAQCACLGVLVSFVALTPPPLQLRDNCLSDILASVLVMTQLVMLNVSAWPSRSLLIRVCAVVRQPPGDDPARDRSSVSAERSFREPPLHPHLSKTDFFVASSPATGSPRCRARSACWGPSKSCG